MYACKIVPSDLQACYLGLLSLNFANQLVCCVLTIRFSALNDTEAWLLNEDLPGLKNVGSEMVFIYRYKTVTILSCLVSESFF